MFITLLLNLDLFTNNVYLILFSICFIEKEKDCPADNRYPLRSKSKVSTHTEGNISKSELSTQEIEPSPNKRPKLEHITLGMYCF